MTHHASSYEMVKYVQDVMATAIDKDMCTTCFLSTVLETAVISLVMKCQDANEIDQLHSGVLEIFERGVELREAGAHKRLSDALQITEAAKKDADEFLGSIIKGGNRGED